MIAQITNSAASSPVVNDVAKLISDLWPQVDAGHAAAYALAVYYVVKALRNRTALGQHSILGPILSFLNMEQSAKKDVPVQTMLANASEQLAKPTPISPAIQTTENKNT